MPNLNTQILGALPVSLPPSCIQGQIASLLEALDGKIAVNARCTGTALELLRAHYSQLSGRACRPARLGDIAGFRYGKALVESDRTPGPIPVFGSNGISGWHDTPLVKGPGIIVGRKGANAGSVSWSPGAFWPIDTAFYVVATAPEVTLEFLYFLLRCAGLRGQVGDSAVPGLNRSIALACDISLPDDAEIARFTGLARPVLDMVRHRDAESRVLAELRDTLLPELVSGRLCLGDRAG